MNYCTKVLVWVIFLCAVRDTYAQEGCIATNLNNTIINLPCSTNCTNLSFQVPHLKSTESYVVSSIPYAPYAYTTVGGNELSSLYVDDVFSPEIILPFNFCFYGVNYNSLVVGSNGLMSFDVSNAGCANAYKINFPIPYALGTQCNQFADYYPRASIMGVYTDLNPAANASPNGRKIEWRVEGTAPCRRFIASYNNIGYFNNLACSNNSPATFQMVIYETTGLIEVYIKQKLCLPSTAPRAILGLQNWDKNAAITAPNKNATVWTESNTAYRFTPSGATSRFLRSELITMAGTVVATTTTGGSSTPGMLDISFSNICPASFPAQYVVRTFYRSCVDATEIFVNDTVTINRASTLTATTSLTQPSCASANGTIAINATGGTAPYQYSLDGVNFQTGNSFTVPAGTYTVYVKDNGGCSFSLNATLNASSGSTSSSFSAAACSSYTLPWGTVVTSTGAYTNTYQTASGCDSVVTATITINNATTSTTNTTICNSQLPYTWNGQTLTAGGTYTATLQSASGCDSVATLNLIVNNGVTSTTNTTICNSQLPYTWNGQTLTAGGPYTATLQSASGCDSVATLNLTVNNAVTSTTNTTICNSQLPYTWNGQTLTIGGTYTATLQSASGCDSVATLNLTVNSSVTSTTNSAICNNQLPYTWNGQTLTAGGTYTATLQSASGCDSIATLNLTVNNAVTSTTNTIICNSQLPYTWNGQTLTAGGTYTATLQSASGCDSVATLNLTVNNAVTSTTNTTICNSQLPYTWNGQTLTAGGTYTATLQSASGCDSVATLNLTVNNAVTSTTNTTICNTQLPYTWNGQTLSTGGTYTATLQSASGCDSVATLNLIVNNSVNSTTNTTICNSQLPYTWNGQTLTTGGTYTATLQSASGCDSVATLNLIVNSGVTSTTNTTICNSQLPYTWNGQTLTAGGTYTATLQSASGCDSVATLNLTVNSGVTSTTNTTICNNQLPYTWNGQTLTAGGTYTATLQSASGCDSVATLNLTVNNAVTSTTNTTICNSQLPYTWNGQTLTAGGTYTATLQSASGCDSVATLNLTVNNAVTSTTNTTICNSQLPYTWNGQTLTAGGTYTATLQSASGCDSVATLNLTVNNAVTSTTNTTICNSQLPYTWNGQTLTAGGTYTATLQSASGCDSVATLNLTVNNAVTSNTNITICDSQLPYSWNGQTLTTGGTYTATLQSVSGCDSVATLNLTVNNAVTSTTNTTICNTQLPYTWNGQTLTAGGTYTATLQSASGCDSVATLNLVVNNAITTTSNITVCNNQLPYSWNGQNLNAGGTYIDTLQSSSGCDSIATLNLTVNNVVTNITDTSICNNQLPFIWNNQNLTQGGVYTDTLLTNANCDVINILNLTVTDVVSGTTNITICNNQLPYSWNGQMYNAAGSYNDTLLNTSGCDSVATLILSVNNIVTSITNLTICSEDLPYSWNGQSLATAGIYSDTLQSQSGCDSIATLNLVIIIEDFATVDTTICSNQLPFVWNGQSYIAPGIYIITLQNSMGCDYVATLNLAVNDTLTSTTNETICSTQLPYTWNGQTFTAAGTYSVTLQSTSGCDSIATLNLVVTPTADASLSASSTICEGESKNLSIQLTGTPPWSLTYSDGVNQVTLNNIMSSPYNLTVSPRQTTTYTLLSVSDVKCTNSNLNSSITVDVSPRVYGITYTPVDVNSNVPLQLSAREPATGYSYKWTPAIGLSQSNIKSPIFQYTNSVTYHIELTSAAGCKTVDTLTVNVIQMSAIPLKGDLFVPKAWSPNGDGSNDYLYPLTTRVRELKYFRVYNRWGQLVFETNVIGHGWDGIFKGQKQMVDNYSWVAEAIGEDGRPILRSGNVLLLK